MHGLRLQRGWRERLPDYRLRARKAHRYAYQCAGSVQRAVSDAAYAQCDLLWRHCLFGSAGSDRVRAARRGNDDGSVIRARENDPARCAVSFYARAAAVSDAKCRTGACAVCDGPESVRPRQGCCSSRSGGTASVAARKRADRGRNDSDVCCTGT